MNTRATVTYSPGRPPLQDVHSNERFWRTLNEDLIDGTTFASPAEFQDELEQYLLYSNEVSLHQALQEHPLPNT